MQVVTSRVIMAAPGMFCLPFIMKVSNNICKNVLSFINCHFIIHKLSLSIVIIIFMIYHHAHHDHFQQMEKKPWFKSRPALHGPFQVPLLLSFFHSPFIRLKRHISLSGYWCWLLPHVHGPLCLCPLPTKCQ